MVDNSIKLTLFKTITLGSYSVLNLHGQLNIIYSAFAFFQDHLEEEKNSKSDTWIHFMTIPMRNKEDTGQRIQGQLHLSSSFAL